MKVSVDATDDELIAKADVLIAHIEDLRDAAQARCACRSDLSKAAQLQIKAHPKVALTQLRRQWVTGYRDQMQAMLAEVGDYLQQLPPKA